MKFMIITRISICFMLFLFLSMDCLTGQNQNQPLNLNQTDLSTIQVDQLTDDQIKQIIQKAEESGLSQDQLIAAATSRGMDEMEVEKLKTRINKLSESKGTTDSQKFRDRSRLYKPTDDSKLRAKYSGNNADTTKQDIFGVFKKNKPQRPEDKLFGFSVFNNKKYTFEPELNIPTPKNYQLGADDQIIIDIWGASQETYRLKITPDGSILIPNVGPIFLNGMSIEEATAKIKKELSKIYSGLNGVHPNTFLNISLGSVRSIKVNLVGDVSMPGTYTLPSLATVFNALYAAGGPSYNGTLRKVKVIRENIVAAELDFYNYLLKGSLENNIRLQDQDVILVNPYEERVEIKGKIKRPMFYDLKPSETLKDLIFFAGGNTSKAYSERISIVRVTGIQNKIYNIPTVHADTFKMANGDEVTIDSVLNRFENRVEIKGAVLRPGIYSIDSTLTIKQLINNANGLAGDAFKSRSTIYRTRDDNTMEVIPFDLNKLLTSDSLDIPLLREDIILISSIFDLKEDYYVHIEGEVNKPGKFLYCSNLTVSDLVISAGGLLESASYAILEVARRIKNNSALNSGNKIAEIYQFQITSDLKLSESASQFILRPFDQIFIRRSPGYELQNLVKIDGEVAFPGHYSIADKNEKISDLIKRAGGLTPEAYVKGARLVRKLPIDKKQRLLALLMITEHTRDSIRYSLKDSSKIADLSLNNETTIGIELDKILRFPGSEYDLLLQKYDSIVIPKHLQTVRMSGSVLYPVTVRYVKNTNFRSYLSQAGGVAPEAKVSKSYIIYANGSIKRTHKVLFFNSFPTVEPGAEIIVPKKPERKRLTAGELIAVTSGLASLSVMIISIIQLTK